MRILECYPDWRDQYIADIQTARDELLKSGFNVNPKKAVMDIYSLPARNHQTFFAELVFSHEIYTIVYAKSLQYSVWFSDPIYKYTFEEAVRFRDDPKRRGQIFCGVKLVNRAFAKGLLDLVGGIAESQPTSAVKPDESADFTALRLYSEGRVSREFLYTDASLLSLSEGCDSAETVEQLNRLHFEIEEIIGLGFDKHEVRDSGSSA